MKKFINLRSQPIEDPQPMLKKYDSNWVESQAKSKISEDDFFELLNELEDRGEISITKSREMFKEFKKLRHKNPSPHKLDEKWIEVHALSDINEEDFE